MPTTIQFLRGLSANLSQITPAQGEPVWVTDTQQFRVGDGTTPGGVPLDFVIPSGTQVDGEVAIWSGGLLGSVSKTVYLDGYATQAWTNTQLDTKLDVNDEAVSAAVATDANNLGGQLPSYYLNTSLRSNAINSTSETNVATSLAAKQAYDRGSAGVSAAATAQATADAKIGAANYATATVGGTLKARLSGDTLYLTNNGSNP